MLRLARRARRPARPDGRRSPTAARRLLPLVGGALLLASCGSPPQPLPTAPPPTSGGETGSGAPSAAPTYVPGGRPATLPAYPAARPTYPVVTPPTAPATVPTTTRRAPSPAPRCTSGPTTRQVLDLVEGRPGIPEEELTVTEGPYCAGSWQFAILGIAGRSADDVEPLLVVSTGRPAALRLVEAGTDVCTERVERDAPPGIRVRACGS